MMELQVTLDFACSGCSSPVNVTVKCAGKGLAESQRKVAQVNVPCPHCGHVSQLAFEPCGIVREVKPYTAPRQMPEPSVN